MQSLLKCYRGILLVFWLESVTVFSATIDPASFYQRSNDGSYRYGYSAGGGINARQSATSANEVVGQYAQLQPDGRIVNVRYKAGVGGFQPQYGAGSSAYNGAAFGGSPGSPGGLGGGSYGGGSLGAGPLSSRSLTGGPGSFGPGSFGPGSFNTPRSSTDGSLNGGSGGAYSPGGGSYVGGPLSATSPGSRSLPGGSSFGPGSFNTPRSSVDGGSTGGGLNGGASLGPGSPASRSPIGGSPGIGQLPASGQLAPGSIGNRSPVGSGSFGRSYLGAGLAGPSYGGFQYPSPRYAVTPAYSGDSNHRRRPPFAMAPTPTPILNTGPLGDGSYRFSYANDNSARTESGDPSGTVRGTYSFQNDAGNHDLSYVAGPNTGFRPTGGSLASPNGLPKPVSSSTTTSAPVTASQSGPRNDGTYNFAYRTPDSTRQESADNRGNVQGSYSFRNENGDHDLSFVAGPSTGFQPTGGSLAVPNGLGQRRPSIPTSTISPIGTTFATTTLRNGSPTDRSFQNEPVSVRDTLGNGDRGRSGLEFEPTDSDNVYTNNGQRQPFTTTVRPESFQNINGGPRYLHQNGGFGRQGSNGAGGVDQRYDGSINNGVQPVNLANTNRLSGDPTSQTGVDGSHGFPYTTSSDNSFADGQHNLRGTSGSLSNNGLSFDRGNGLNYGPGSGNGGSFANSYGASGGGGQNFGTRSGSSKGGSDGSYNFSYDTGRQAHRESSDGRGRVDGRYSYLSDGGQRSLSYRIRPGTGFEVIGGNLASKTPK
ncbi:uncharacterized PE-PGRS family protein PE_PGRS54-like [Ochlerotatus camptorhynchus]|uniref:uncharacterized PE-PGRS family protein PE_PGRS54-like n=1 Tax=Ochlerotatus camptorhynchus TaxID=644619 RepID=UPI0031D20F5A